MHSLFKSFDKDALLDICQYLYSSKIIDNFVSIFGEEMTPTEIIAAARIEAGMRGLIDRERNSDEEDSSCIPSGTGQGNKETMDESNESSEEGV